MRRALVALLLLAATPALAAERSFPRAALAAAEGALLAGDVGAARTWLERVRTQDRDVAWRLLRAETDRSVRVAYRAVEGLTDVATAGDSLLAVVGDDGMLLLLDAGPPGGIRAITRAHAGAAYAVAVHPRGLLATCGADGTIRLASLATLDSVAVIRPGASRRATDVSFSPDGTRLAASLNQGGVRVWDVRDPARPDTVASLRGHVTRPPVAAIAFGGDASVLASAGWDQRTIVWDLPQRAAARTFGPGYGTAAPYTRFDDLAFAGDRLLAASSRGVHAFGVRDSTNGWLREDHAGPVACVALDAARGTVATGGDDRTVRLRDLADGATRTVLRGHEGGVTAAAFDPGGRLWTTSTDGTLRQWDPAAAAARAFVAHDGGVWGLALSADGSVIATASTDDTVSVWRRDTADTAPRRVLALGDLAPAAAALALAPDGSRGVVATNGGTVRGFDAVTGRPGASYAGHTGPVQAVAYTPDLARVVTAGHDGTVRVFDASNGDSLAVFRTGAGRATSVAVSPDGERIVTGFADGRVRLFAIGERDGVPVTLDGPGGAVTSVAFAPAGRRLVVGSERGRVRFFDARNRKVLADGAAHREAVYGLAFLPASDRLVSASYDRTIRVWDATDGTVLVALRVAQDGLYGVAVAADGGTIAAGGLDGRVHIFDARP